MLDCKKKYGTQDRRALNMSFLFFALALIAYMVKPIYGVIALAFTIGYMAGIDFETSTKVSK